MGPDDKYEALCVIGKGTFGRVSKVQRRSDGMILAWKELYYGDMSEKEKQQLVAEVNILRELQHSNIVKYYDRVIDRTTKKIYVVMEFCAGGDLATYIKTMHSQRCADTRVVKVFVLTECHQQTVDRGTLHLEGVEGNSERTAALPQAEIWKDSPSGFETRQYFPRRKPKCKAWGFWASSHAQGQRSVRPDSCRHTLLHVSGAGP
eukprot:1391463-Amorphochlora_amoeboformis.AAC.1